MTSATIKPDSGAGGRHAEGRGYGLIVFASILLFVDGFFNMLYGIAAIANSHVFVANAHYVIGDLRAWGWVTLIIAVLQLAAGAGVLAGNQLARWFAVAVVGDQRHRDDVLPAGLPLLGAGHHRHRCDRAVRAVRLRQPEKPGRLLAPRARTARDRNRPEPNRNGEARYKPSNRGSVPGFARHGARLCQCAAFRVRLGFWFTGHSKMAPGPACTRRPACLKEVLITAPAVERTIVQAGAAGSSPRRGTSEPGIACFILTDAGSPAPVVNDHCANGRSCSRSSSAWRSGRR